MANVNDARKLFEAEVTKMTGKPCSNMTERLLDLIVSVVPIYMEAELNRLGVIEKKPQRTSVAPNREYKAVELDDNGEPPW